MKFREFTLETGRKIFLGKNAENNDELVETADENDTLLHTSAPGSPFCNLGEKPGKKELKQAAIICAKFSQDWRDNKKDVIIHQFKKKDTIKKKTMKTGTWQVKKQKKIFVKKKEIEEFENAK